MGDPCVIVAGNLSEGFRVIGPFPDFDEAAKHCSVIDTETWIMTLESPKDKGKDND